MPTSSLAAVLKFNGDPRGAVDAINKVGNTIKNLEGKVNGLNQRMNSSGSQGGRIFGSLVPVLNSVHRTITNVSNSTRLLAQGITNVGRAVMFFIGLPLAAALTAGFRVAISYEDALVRVAKTTGFPMVSVIWQFERFLPTLNWQRWLNSWVSWACGMCRKS
jgi:hypothetical protein